MAHRFNPDHLDRLLGEERRALLPPETVIELLALGPSDTVADVGAGPGYFTVPIAERTRGTVYAMDVEPRMLAALTERWPGGVPAHVRIVQGSAEALGLGDAVADRLLYAFVLHEVEDLDRALGEAVRALRPGGRAVVVEWVKERTEAGPPVEERLDGRELSLRLRSRGFEVEGPLDLNGVHYALVARRR